MKTPFGIPGIGGSLGQCAVCGDTFLLNIITGEKVESFELEGFENTFYAHKKCRPKLVEGMDVLTLPEASPIRRAAEKHFAAKPNA